MKLTIENIRKIHRADIQLDGITVICGENNTGKSTVGKCLYYLQKALYNCNPSSILQTKKDAILDNLKPYLIKVQHGFPYITQLVNCNSVNEVISILDTAKHEYIRISEQEADELSKNIFTIIGLTNDEVISKSYNKHNSFLSFNDISWNDEIC